MHVNGYKGQVYVNSVHIDIQYKVQYHTSVIITTKKTFSAELVSEGIEGIISVFPE